MNKFLLCSDNLLDQTSCKKKFLFIHIPKTAGTSVACALSFGSAWKTGTQWRQGRVSEHDSQKYGFGRWTWNQSPDLEKHQWERTASYNLWQGISFPRSEGGLYWHLPAFFQKKMLSETWDEYFKFCFVRNPWAWMVSWYHFHTQFSSVNPKLRDCLLSYKDFKSFIKGEPIYQPSDLTRWIVDDKGASLLDYVGKVENIQENFNEVCDIIGMEKKTRWFQLCKQMASKHGNYRDYYDSESKKIVAKRFAKTIDLFKYTF